MKPIDFKEVNITYAKDQPEYIPLPGHKVNDDRGEFIFCMRLSFIERLRLLITGKLWCSLLTFNKPLTPSFFTTKKSDVFTDLQLSWFGKLNYYFLQFLCIRLTRHTGDEEYWSLQYWIKPMTGWSDDFQYFGKQTESKFLRITKKLNLKEQL